MLLMSACAPVRALQVDLSLPVVAANAPMLATERDKAVQLLAVRPALSRRSDAVLASAPGEGHQRSSAHLYYVALEAIKVVALVVTGLLLFGGVG